MHKLQLLPELATIAVVHQMTLFIAGEILSLGQTRQRNVSLSKNDFDSSLEKVVTIFPYYLKT